MRTGRPVVWIRGLTGVATFVHISGWCLAVAVVVIGLAPGSSVPVDVPAAAVTALGEGAGLAAGAIVDPGGYLRLAVSEPSLAQRLAHAGAQVPVLLVIADVARRMSGLLRASLTGDPFSADTVRTLIAAAKVSVFGGVGAWVFAAAAEAYLVTTVVDGVDPTVSATSPLVWSAVGLVLAAFAWLTARGVEMRDELDTVI